VTPFSLVVVDQHFRGTCCLDVDGDGGGGGGDHIMTYHCHHHYLITINNNLMLRAAVSFEMSVYFYQMT
jgi:hypothetical protein